MSEPFPPAPASYSRINENIFRGGLQRSLQGFIRADRAIDRLLFTDRDTDEVVVVTVESGVLVVTPL